MLAWITFSSIKCDEVVGTLCCILLTLTDTDVPKSSQINWQVENLLYATTYGLNFLEQSFQLWLKRFEEPSNEQQTQVAGSSLYASVTYEKPAEKKVNVGDVVAFSREKNQIFRLFFSLVN